MAKPAYRVYTVIKRDNKEDYWLNLGVAFPHEDGEGFNLLLQALPLDPSSRRPSPQPRRSSNFRTNKAGC